VSAVLSLAWAPAAGAAALTGGCSGTGISSDSDGSELDQASAPGAGATKSDPFLVDPDGTVAWEGTTGVAFHDHSWNVKVWGAKVKSGGSANGDDLVEDGGVEEVSDYLPFDAVGLYKVTGSISAAEGTCKGSGWIKVTGSPVATPAWIAGLVLVLGGGALLAGPAIGMFRKAA
jgi:hypothetical protein